MVCQSGDADHELAAGKFDLRRCDNLVRDLALARCALDGVDDARICAAMADMRTHVLDDLVAVRIRLLLKQIDLRS